MKKVAILSLHLSYGGIEKSIVALANILAEKYQVEIACIYKIQKKEVDLNSISMLSPTFAFF